MLSDPDLARESDQPVTRQIQFERRRHTISVEAVYWAVLEDAARSERLRLNQLIGKIAAAPGPDNLAARLRLYCVRRLKRRLEETESEPQDIDLARLVEACPAPCFVMSRDLTIVRHNAPFRKWLELTPADLTDIPFSKHFRLRLSRSLPELHKSFPDPCARIETGTLTCLLSGRLLARPVSACMIPLPRPYSFVWLVFVR